ncbi:hypothetical protein So717_41900 [Roseobacter cerasinus]|uniref:Pimeloyl-CoA dehydrogenase large subunit n=1 Tax=Roseobacter cerasinus TaxID=2602289 RepID=A0A640VX03_9RHOB|nr:acyl-CoA dehydrogenase family protein [Roseobacter cerasinus]GFE52437.1 hypothetical protein So717_41900 [Roseobacter cerasinus]
MSSVDYDAFRTEVKAFLANALSENLKEKIRLGLPMTKADHEEWHAILNDKGWLAVNWPVEYGGTGWDGMQRQIYEIEACLANAPRVVPFGLAMMGPILQKFGNDTQKAYFLPRILNGEHWWCQGYSEPGAGSDLASLKTKAVRDGDHYVVNGQKTWTTLAQHANWIFCLVRTDPNAKKQEGISFLLIDMTTPGVEVRPIELLDGDCEVNEVWFDNVRVPVENLIGEENEGWTYAKYLLTHERTNIAGVGFSNANLIALKAIAQKEQLNGQPLADNPRFAARMAEVEIDLMAMATTNLRTIAKVASGQAPGVESSMLKIKGTEIRQEIDDLTRRAVGPYAVPKSLDALAEGNNNEQIGPDYAASASVKYFNNRKLTIFGGSTEVQRSIISKSVLGL